MTFSDDQPAARGGHTFTLHLTVYGQAIEPTEHETFSDLGDTLTAELGDADIELKPHVISVLLSLIFRDLRTHPTWRWVAEDYQIFVARNDP